MPRKGYRLITVPEHVNRNFERKWKQKKDEYSLRGVRSLSGYVNMKLRQLIEADEKSETKDTP